MKPKHRRRLFSAERRQALSTFSGAAFLAAFGTGLIGTLRQFALPLSHSDRTAITAMIDELMPAGDGLPGALDLGLDKELWRRAQRYRTLKLLLKDGADWLEQQALQAGVLRFEYLDGAQRRAIIAEAERQPDGSRPKEFFLNVRQMVFAEYYADPRVAAFTGMPRPPQPAGFMDYTSPPAHRLP